jgi:preprotein translocase subunit SecF
MFAVIHRNIFLGIAAVIMLGSIAVIGVLGLRLGIDFTGGSLTEIMYSGETPEKAAVETKLSELGLGSFSVRESSDETGRQGYIVRSEDLSEAERVAQSEALTGMVDGAEITRFTSIGPVIGEELKDKAVWAIGAVSLVIVLYIAFAFAGIGTPVSSWVYGGTTILVLIHDVLVPTALISLLGFTVGIEVDVLFVMAILAVLGYSVNDTIVIFDRVRENLIQNRTEHRTKRSEAGVIREDVTYTLNRPYEELVGEAVTQSMARSINTSLTTLLALVALYFIGGTATQTFALVLIAGVVAGTYSSIFIASPLVVAYAKWQASKQTT